jgi:hypothetical protein
MRDGLNLSRRFRGPEGCDFKKDEKGETTWRCNSGGAVMPHEYSIKLLQRFGARVTKSLLYFEAHGGHCDCEVVFNVESAPYLKEPTWLDYGVLVPDGVAEEGLSLCGLCGNSGQIVLERRRYGGRWKLWAYCLCPNGQHARARHEASAPLRSAITNITGDAKICERAR